MKREGFTLIELLAVIVVLSIILVITVPKITESINNSKLAAFENQKKIMLRAGKEYVQLEGDKKDGKITYDELITGGKLKNGIKDNKGKELDKYHTIIDIVNNIVTYSTRTEEVNGI